METLVLQLFIHPAINAIWMRYHIHEPYYVNSSFSFGTEDSACHDFINLHHFRNCA